MTYAESLEYLFGQLPMYHRIGAPAYRADLSNTIALCKQFGNPERKFKSIHVAGTNGKGSVCSALASIFAECGYKTGLFTSPHFFDFRERIRINGRKIPAENVVDFVERLTSGTIEGNPSFFEATTAMAFTHFAEMEVDIAIVETGLGGRLDSTNVVVPELSVITSISPDHQYFLGNTIAAIAGEKGGIIKPGVPVVIGENPDEATVLLRSMASAANAPVTSVFPDSPGLETDLTGSYQAANMRIVRAAVDTMAAAGWKLGSECVERGAKKVKANTGLRGRWDILGRPPLIIADAAHNEGGVREAMKTLAKLEKKRLHVVWGMVADKDASTILSLLPKDADYYWCKPNIPRGKDVESLQAEAKSFGLDGSSHPSVSAAFESAKRQAAPDDVIFVGGSIFVLAEALPQDEAESE